VDDVERQERIKANKLRYYYKVKDTPEYQQRRRESAKKRWEKVPRVYDRSKQATYNTTYYTDSRLSAVGFRRWSAEDEKLVLESAVPDATLASLLKRSIKAIEIKRVILKKLALTKQEQVESVSA
jgi:hypothetical protein